MRSSAKIVIEEYSLQQLRGIENHRVEGELFCQYKFSNATESESIRIERVVLDTSEFDDIDDFRKLTLEEIERLMKERASQILEQMVAAKK